MYGTVRSGNRLLMKLYWDESTETELIQRTLIRASRLKRHTTEAGNGTRIEWKNSIA